VPQLARAGASPITGTGVTVLSGSQITCQFNLVGAAEGAYDVVVTNPSMASGVLPEGFYVPIEVPS
jgi:hypothetical protein